MLICEQSPDFFVLENVKGLLSTAKHRAFFNRMVKKLHRFSYATTFRLINALEYGTAQDRQRVILIGIKLPLCATHVDAKNGTIADFPWNKFVRFNMDDVQKVDWPTTDGFREEGARPMPKGIIEELTVQHWFEKNDVEKTHENPSYISEMKISISTICHSKILFYILFLFAFCAFFLQPFYQYWQVLYT